MDQALVKNRRGRRSMHDIALLPDGTTPRQRQIMQQLAADRGISLASLRREIIKEYLAQFDFSDEDQGLITKEQ